MIAKKSNPGTKLTNTANPLIRSHVGLVSFPAAGNAGALRVMQSIRAQAVNAVMPHLKSSNNQCSR